MRIGILIATAILLGGCSSAMDYTSSISDQEALRIGSSITSKDERQRLIDELKTEQLNHRIEALREIEDR